MKTYKSQPVHVDIRLHELVDVTVRHPLRCHHEQIPSHRHAQQLEHVRMAEGPPCRNLPAKPLRDTVNR